MGAASSNFTVVTGIAANSAGELAVHIHTNSNLRCRVDGHRFGPAWCPNACPFEALTHNPDVLGKKLIAVHYQTCLDRNFAERAQHHCRLRALVSRHPNSS